MQVLYFAYGSNMSTERTKARISLALTVGLAYLKDKKMVFNKRSCDGSGKANLVDSLGDVTWGVLYEVEAPCLEDMDGYEKGYDRVQVQVCRSDREVVEAATYVSDDLTEDPRACDRYKEWVLSGAREHCLPNDYVAYIEKLPSKPCT